jgi:hypothetical protein
LNDAGWQRTQFLRLANQFINLNNGQFETPTPSGCNSETSFLQFKIKILTFDQASAGLHRKRLGMLQLKFCGPVEEEMIGGCSRDGRSRVTQASFKKK